MKTSGRPLKTYKSWLARIFIISFIVFLGANTFWVVILDLPPPPIAGPITESGKPSFTITTQQLISLVSLITSVTSLIGFLVTACISWRKERREGAHSDLDLEKKKLELEKLRLDIARISQENSLRSKGPSDLL